MTNKKRGQVTLFIIIGIILLIGIIVILSISEQKSKEEIVPGVRIATEDVPFEFQPVKVYVESCIEDVAMDGLKRLGERGGYIEPSNFGIAAPYNPTDGNGVRFSPGSELIVPYWFYLKSDNLCIGTCEFSSERPPLYRNEGEKSIESQLDKYVNEKLAACLDNFKPIEEKGIDVEPAGGISTETIVAESDVVFVVSYPLKVRIGETEEKLTQFFIKMPINFKRIYNLATHLADLEAEDKYLEKDMLNLIVGFSGKDKDKLPPMAESGLEFSPALSWRKSKVKEDLVNILSSYIQLLQVDGTYNYRPYAVGDSELRSALYNTGMTIPTNESYASLAPKFNYLGFWEPYFDLNCDGEICRPESLSISIIQFGIQRYNFVYDLSFPVMVTINDPFALNNRGYDFRFFLEGNIRNNEPMRTEFRPLISLPAENSMLCDLDKRNSGNIKVTARDANNSALLDDVNVAYTCGAESCMIGPTENGVLEDKFPICLGGIVSYIKRDYLGKSQFLNTKIDKEEQREILLEPLTDKKFVVMKKKMKKGTGGWAFDNNAVSLDSKEEAILSLTRIGEEGDEAYSAGGEYKAGGEPGDIRLAAGKYRIEINMFLYDNFIIPSEERCEGSFLSEECYELPQVAFNETNPYPSGGLKLNYTFTNDDLSKDKIVFYALNIDLKGTPQANRKFEDIEESTRIEEYSEQNKNLLTPSFE